MELEPLTPVFPVGTDIVPWTIRYGAGLMGTVEQMRDWLDRSLVPYVNTNLGVFVGEITIEMAQLNASVNARLAANEATTDARLTANEATTDARLTANELATAQRLSDNLALVAARLTENEEGTAAQLASNLVAVNEAIQRVIDQSIEVQDPVIAGVLADALSQSRLEANRIYVQPPVRLDGNQSVAPLTYVTPEDFGAVGDNETDDGDALIATITAAGNGARIQLGHGKVYRSSKPITLLPNQHLVGTVASFGSGATTRAELAFDAGVLNGLILRTYAAVSNLVVRGPGDALANSVGIKTYDADANPSNNSHALALDKVSVYGWETGVRLFNVYYAELNRIETRRCAVGFRILGSLNITMREPQINCQKADGAPGIGIWGAARGLTVIGGSIEQFLSGIRPFNSESLTVVGTYFESTLVAANIRAIDAPAFINTTINLTGCYVYMPNLTTFVEHRGGTGRVLNARGNTFISGTVGNVASAAGYRFTVGAGQVVNLDGDNWERVEPADMVYVAVDGGSLPAIGTRVSYPMGYDAVTQFPGSTSDGHLIVKPVQRITHSVAGALSIDPRFGEVEVTLGANVTSVVLANPGVNDQLLKLTFIQPAGGAFTVAQPGFFRWNANAAPADPAANTRTTVVYQFKFSTGRWFEQHRSVNMGN